jgi:hypothetical protein
MVRMVEVPDDEDIASANGFQPAVAPAGLRVSGFMVTKADLIAALRVYVPGLVDLAVTDDGETFCLMLDPGGES